MKRVVSAIGLAVGLLVLGFGVGRATDSVSEDAEWWQSEVPQDSRLYVTEGGLDAYADGWLDGVIAEGSRIADEAHNVSPTFARQTFAIVYRKDQSGTYASVAKAPTFSRTFAYYIAAISDFYLSRSAAASKVPVGDVIGCLADHPAFTCDHLEKMSTSN